MPKAKNGIQIHIGPEAIRKVRDALAETQGQLATRLGVSQATVSRWEAGQLDIQGPAKLLLVQILQSYGMLRA